MVRQALFVLIAAVFVQVLLAHKEAEHDGGLRLSKAGDSHANRLAQRLAFLRENLAGRGIVLGAEHVHDSGYAVKLVVSTADNSAELTCSAPATSASDSDLVVVTARYSESELRQAEPTVIKCSEDAEYLTSGSGKVQVKLEGAPLRVHAMMIVKTAGQDTYAIADYARFGEHPSWHQSGEAKGWFSRVWQAIGGGVAPPVRSLSLVLPSPSPKAESNGTTSSSSSSGSGPGVTTASGDGLTDEEKKAEEKVQKEEASAGLVIAALGVAAIVFQANKYARHAAGDEPEVGGH